MKLKWPKVTLIEVLILIAFLAIGASIIGAVKYELEHPCIEWREDLCTTRECTKSNSLSDHTGPIAYECLRWEERTYPCKTCTKRKP